MSDQKVSNNVKNYSTTSNYRWYYRQHISKTYNARMLGMPELPKELPVTSLDRKYKVETKYAGRLDMIAKNFYGSDYRDMMWIIMLYNGIRDPWKEVEAGTELYIPDRSTIEGRLI